MSKRPKLRKRLRIPVIACYVSTAVVCVDVCSEAHANLRAPRMVLRSPSSSLYSVGAHLVVQREQLSFTCSRRDCQVEAVYHVLSLARMRQALEFICPGDNRLAVRVGGSKLPPRRVRSVPLAREEQERVRRKMGLGTYGRGTSLHKARFAVSFRQGLNTIHISYRQRLSSHERDYGYFSDGRLVHQLQYELWPLKGWRLDPRFNLSLKVKLRRAAPSWWARNLGRYTKMECHKQGRGRALGARPVQQKGYLVLAARLGADFPDRLICSIGDDDLI